MIWIRNQDKTRLIKVEDARILGCSDGCSDIWANNNCNLGKYSTKEKALKVLDKMQEHITKTKIYDTEKGEYERYRTLPLKIVFQMPQDSEV